MLGLIKRNFIHLTEEAFVTLYESLPRWMSFGIC